MQSTLKSLTLCATIVVGLAPAQQPQSEGPIEKRGGYWVQEITGSLAQPIRLTVSAIGDIRVEGRDVDRVSYRVIRKAKASNAGDAEKLFERALLATSRRGPSATLTLQDPQCGRCGFTSEIEISVPRRLRETIIRAAAGSLSVQGIEGGVSANSAVGSIEMNAIGGGVMASTAGGPITLGAIGGAVRCETAGGSIKLRASGGEATLTSNGGGIEVGSVGGTLRAETLGGDVVAERVAGEVIAATSGGTIRIGQARGRVTADTAGGSIEIAGAPQGVRAETAEGHIRLTDVSGQVFATSANGNIHAFFVSGSPLRDSLIETMSGTIIIWLPADARVAVDAQVDLARSMGRIESDFEAITVRQGSEQFGASELRATGSLNGGGPVLTIRNTGGRIQIRRRETE